MLIICIEIVARCMLVALFLPFSALDKVLNFKQAVGQASQAAANRGLATALIVAGLCIEIVMSTAIVTGVADRLAALVLAGYCAVTAVLWKQFWKKPDFKLQGTSLGRDTFWDFLKNLALAGGFSHAGIRQCGRRSSVSGCAPSPPRTPTRFRRIRVRRDEADGAAHRCVRYYQSRRWPAW